MKRRSCSGRVNPRYDRSRLLLVAEISVVVSLVVATTTRRAADEELAFFCCRRSFLLTGGGARFRSVGLRAIVGQVLLGSDRVSCRRTTILPGRRFTFVRATVAPPAALSAVAGFTFLGATAVTADTRGKFLLRTRTTSCHSCTGGCVTTAGGWPHGVA